MQRILRNSHTTDDSLYQKLITAIDDNDVYKIYGIFIENRNELTEEEKTSCFNKIITSDHFNKSLLSTFIQLYSFSITPKILNKIFSDPKIKIDRFHSVIKIRRENIKARTLFKGMNEQQAFTSRASKRQALFKRRNERQTVTSPDSNKPDCLIEVTALWLRIQKLYDAQDMTELLHTLHYQVTYAPELLDELIKDKDPRKLPIWLQIIEWDVGTPIDNSPDKNASMILERMILENRQVAFIIQRRQFVNVTRTVCQGIDPRTSSMDGRFRFFEQLPGELGRNILEYLTPNSLNEKEVDQIFEACSPSSSGGLSTQPT